MSEVLTPAQSDVEDIDGADLYGRAAEQARRHLAVMSPERRAMLEREWSAKEDHHVG